MRRRSAIDAELVAFGATIYGAEDKAERVSESRPERIARLHKAVQEAAGLGRADEDEDDPVETALENYLQVGEELAAELAAQRAVSGASPQAELLEQAQALEEARAAIGRLAEMRGRASMASSGRGSVATTGRRTRSSFAFVSRLSIGPLPTTSSKKGFRRLASLEEAVCEEDDSEPGSPRSASRKGRASSPGSPRAADAKPTRGREFGRSATSALTTKEPSSPVIPGGLGRAVTTTIPSKDVSGFSRIASKTKECTPAARSLSKTQQSTGEETVVTAVKAVSAISRSRTQAGGPNQSRKPAAGTQVEDLQAKLDAAAKEMRKSHARDQERVQEIERLQAKMERDQLRAETARGDCAVLVNVIRQLHHGFASCDASCKRLSREAGTRLPQSQGHQGWFQGRVANLMCQVAQGLELAAHATRAAEPVPAPQLSDGLASLDPKIYAQLLQNHAHIRDEGEVQRRMERAVSMLGKHVW